MKNTQTYSMIYFWGRGVSVVGDMILSGAEERADSMKLEIWRKGKSGMITLVDPESGEIIAKGRTLELAQGAAKAVLVAMAQNLSYYVERLPFNVKARMKIALNQKGSVRGSLEGIFEEFIRRPRPIRRPHSSQSRSSMTVDLKRHAVKVK